MAKPKKRKEYIEEAERCALRLFAVYFKEHNNHATDSVIKSAMTKGRNFAHSGIYMEARRRLGIDGYHAGVVLHQHPNFNDVLEQIFKEIEEDVDDFWLRQHNS